MPETARAKVLRWLTGLGLVLLALLLGMPPAGAQPDVGVWRIAIVTGRTQSEAEGDLAAFADLEDVAIYRYQGQFGIFAGSYRTEQAAREAAQRLADEAGLISPEVVLFPADAPTGPAPPDASETDTGRFRVVVGRFGQRANAATLEQTLLDKGLLDVEIEQSRDGQFIVYAGFQYPSRAEAEAFQDQLRDLGIDILEIVNLDATDATQPLRPRVSERENELLVAFRAALAENDFPRAARIVSDWQNTDATSPLLAEAQAELIQRQAAAASSTPTPIPEGFEVLSAQAEQAEREGRLQDAIAIWRRIQTLRDLTDEQGSTASGAISRINQRIFEQREAGETDARNALESSSGGGDSGGGILTYVIIGGVVLIIAGGGVVFFLMRSKAGAPAPAARAAGGPAMLSGGGIGSGASARSLASGAPSAAGAAAKPPPGRKPGAPAAKPTPKPERPPSSESIQLDGGDAPEAAPAKAFGDASPDKVPSSSSVDIEGAFTDGPPASASKEAPAEAAPEKPAPPPDKRRIPLVRETSGQETEEEVPVGEVKKAEPIAPKPMPAPPVPAGPRVFFEQTFDDEEPEAIPNGWSGEYGYASLKIVDRDGGEGRCLRFEKTAGNGSALFSCKFPDATGRLVVQYDLRCDNKNKYLLGFYLEKDADFRHSVHTVVHRDISNPNKVSLRLQNEPAAYELGKWVRIRFHIDLLRGLMDGYLNDDPVALGVRIASRPKSLNTLSIRDNLATEGVLLIDNIRVFQDR